MLQGDAPAAAKCRRVLQAMNGALASRARVRGTPAPWQD
jgi:hypothetical protein